MNGRACAVVWAGLSATMVAGAGDPVLVATDAPFGSAMVYHLDPASAQVLSAVDLVGTGATGRTPLAALAFDGGGQLMGFTPTSDNELYRVDRATGEATRGGRLGITAREGGMAVFADGTIYATRTGSPARLFTINPATGRATLGPTLFPETDISGLGARADGILIGLDLRTTEGPPSLRAIDPDTGETAVIAPLLPAIELSDVGGLEIIEVGGVETGFYIVAPLAAGGEAQLWRFDPYTGVQEPVGVIAGVGPVTGLAGLPCEACAADLDGDCEATIFDFLVLGNWIQAGDVRGDINGDGSVDLFDFLFFLNVFEDGC